MFFTKPRDVRVHFDGPDGECAVYVGSFRVPGSDGKPVPQGIWAFGEGTGRDLRDAEDRIRQRVDDVVAVLSFLSNAATEEPSVEMVYDITPGKQQHEALFSSEVDHYATPPATLRRPPNCLPQCLKSLIEHESSERLWRGVSSYVAALRSWRKGHEPIALAFLYMAMEALTVIARKPLFEQHGGVEGLAAAWDIDKKQVDGEIRKRVLFAGNVELYRKAKLASDSMEHGFGTMEAIADIAEQQVEELAELVRTYLVHELFPPGTLRKVLLSPAFKKPLGCVPARLLLRGTLQGNAPELRHPNQHPSIQFRAGPASVQQADGADWEVLWDYSDMVPALAAGVSFIPGALEVNDWRVDGVPTKLT